MNLPENYKKDKLTINLVWANVVGVIILFPIGFLFGLPYYLIWKNDFTVQNFKHFMDQITPTNLFVGFSVYLFLLIAGTILHELIHGITWSFYTDKGFKSIKFGILWKMLTPYCHCEEPLTVNQYIKGAIMPAIILGIIPALISIAIGNPGLLAFGIFFTMAAGGDFMIINLLRKENKNNLVEDHPSEAGCFIYRKIENK